MIRRKASFRDSEGIDTNPDGNEAEFDAVVLGAGISGLVAASVLSRQGYSRVLVVDEFDHVGGNHIDYSNAGYTFDVGSLIFQDDSPLLNHFPEILSLYVQIDPSWGKLTPQGHVTQYPFSLKDDVLRSGVLGCLRIALSIGAARVLRRPIGNARDFARHWIGSYLLQRSGLESYMSRFFGVPAEQVDLEFAEKRMLWIKEHASPKVFMRHLVRRPAATRSNHQLARPKSGFAELYAPAVARLRAAGVTFRLGAPIRAIRKSNTRFAIVRGAETYWAKRVISTIPIDRAVSLCGLNIDPKLTSVTLISLFYSFSGQRGFPQSILYNFTHDGAWKRLTVYSDFYGLAQSREYFGVEVIAEQVGGSVAAADADFRRHAIRNNLFAGDLRLEGSRIVSNAYPIHVGRAAERVAAALAELSRFGVESFGRQGAFNYQPTARVSTVEAEAALLPERTATTRA